MPWHSKPIPKSLCERCEKKATRSVFGKDGWVGDYCDKHAKKIIDRKNG